MTVLDETRNSLERIQQFDTSKLPRHGELGVNFVFDGAVEPANRIISLFKKLPMEALDEYPDAQLNQIKKEADQLYNRFEEILKFDDTAPEALSRREQMINQLESQYDGVFKQIHPFISYSVARTVDFNRLEQQGRATLQAITDKTNSLLTELEEAKEQADATLEEVRTAAAEQGVSQQAHYFKTEADGHIDSAEKWKRQTIWWAIAIIAYSIATFFLHKIPFLAPATLAESITFTASKILLFAVLGYMLLLSARNFLAHRHNETVNRHRQNALQTFQALVNASGSAGSQDIVLTHAASCIFSPQDSGYTRSSSSSQSPSATVVDLAMRSAMRPDSSTGT